MRKNITDEFTGQQKRIRQYSIMMTQENLKFGTIKNIQKTSTIIQRRIQ